MCLAFAAVIYAADVYALMVNIAQGLHILNSKNSAGMTLRATVVVWGGGPSDWLWVWTTALHWSDVWGAELLLRSFVMILFGLWVCFRFKQATVGFFGGVHWTKSTQNISSDYVSITAARMHPLSFWCSTVLPFFNSKGYLLKERHWQACNAKMQAKKGNAQHCCSKIETWQKSPGMIPR